MTNFAENFDPEKENLNGLCIFFQCIIWILTIYNVFLELQQVYNFKFINYCSDPWNYLYNTIYFLTSLMLLNDTKMKIIPYVTE